MTHRHYGVPVAKPRDGCLMQLRRFTVGLESGALTASRNASRTLAGSAPPFATTVVVAHL
jgi:hypothetical protein